MSVDISESAMENTSNNTNTNSTASNSKRGVFIVFEGIDRSGKSTQCRELLSYLKKTDIKHEFLRYPDRSSESGQLINSYLQGSKSLNDRAIHLLFAANRHEDTPKILNLLNNGVNIICDRYSFSGAAYSAAKIKNNDNKINTKNSTKNGENSKKTIETSENKTETTEKFKENINTNSKINKNNNSSNNNVSDSDYYSKNSKNSNKNNNKNNNTNKNGDLIDWNYVMSLDWCLSCEEGLPKPDRIVYLNLDLKEAQNRGGFGNERYEKVDFLKRVQTCYKQMQLIQKNRQNWTILDANRSPEAIHKDIVEIVKETIAKSSEKEIDFM